MQTNLKRLYTALCVSGLLGIAGAAQATVVVTATDSGNTLTNEILGAGITVNSVTYTGASAQSGTFTNGLSAGIGIESGIIMTTGYAVFAEGPNSSDSKGANRGGAGDTQLNVIVSATTYDAATLTIDFTTTFGEIFFNFVFASEEYNEYVNASVNDVFAFFLDGVNIALVPSDGHAISIDTVNNGSHSDLYNDNDYGDFAGSPPYDIEYDGFTTVLTVTASGLGTGNHIMKLAIADTGDSIYDSAVFIQGGTFSGTETPVNNVPEPGTLAVFGLGLIGIGWMRRRRAA